MENLPKALVGVHLLRWIATYPVDKAIRSLNNWGQMNNKCLPKVVQRDNASSTIKTAIHNKNTGVSLRAGN